jgi:hypothetical protein
VSGGILATAQGSGSAEGLATVTGEGQRKISAPGAAIGSSSSSAVILAFGRTDGSIAGEATVSAEARAFAMGSGSIAGDATVAGAIDGRSVIQGAISGESTVEDVPAYGRGIVDGNETGTSSATASILAYGRQVGDAAGEASSIVTLYGRGPILGLVYGTAELEGQAVGYGAVDGSAEGDATVSGRIRNRTFTPDSRELKVPFQDRREIIPQRSTLKVGADSSIEVEAEGRTIKVSRNNRRIAA